MAKELFRNKERTQHWGVRQKFSKIAREQSKIITLASSPKKFAPTKDIPITIIFNPPDRRRRDLDGMHSALKPTLDGISDAIGVDDQYFNPVILRRGKVYKGGQVEIILGS